MKIYIIKREKYVWRKSNMYYIQISSNAELEPSNARPQKLIYVNVDDEQNILKMNKRMFGKAGVELVCCINRHEFLEYLKTLSAQRAQADFKVVALMDHMLDLDYGYEVIQASERLNESLGLRIEYIMVSSSEGKATYSYYQDYVKDCVYKPLTLKKTQGIIQITQM
eukprot:Mrub_07527.p1 GENE.Mrub_07527~~Mrub_07527.p1  ORF type:complete len:167 (-),score=58.27 Mrub_07527:80-580(-)